MTVRRREFFATIPVALASATAFARQGDVNEALRAFLQPHVLKRSTLDQFLDSKAQVWAKFDPELGYLLRNAFVRDGVDGCHTLARYQESGQRQQVNFPDQPCRMNTYGDSFTQGHQVSDGETNKQRGRRNKQRGCSTFEPIDSYGNFPRHPMLASATVMA